jgi:two-component sensor histidine kinase
MIQKIKKQFVLTTIFLFTAVFTVIAFIYSTYSNYGFYQDTYAELEWLSNQSDLKEGNKSLEQCFDFDMTYFGYNPIYIYKISPKNKVLESFSIGKNSSNSKEQLEASVLNKIIKSDTDDWKYRSVVFYHNKQKDGNTLLIATDCHSGYEWWYTSTALILFVVSLGIITIIAIGLSHFIAEPAEEALNMERRFLSDSGHELKTPLAGLIVNLQVAEQLHPEDMSIMNATKAATHLSDLVQDILTLSVTDEKLESPSEEIFSLSDTTNEVLNNMDNPIELAGLTLTEDIPPNIFCPGSKEQIRKMITVIMENAIKYNKQSGTIDITLQLKASSAILTVTDTGIGISEEDLPHIFERFYMTDKSHSGSSTGLGLSIAESVVRKHNGKINVESKLGEGTKITVHLPAKRVRQF